ncbi:hypothetical protein KR032_003573 [Drosophila birchii]|nr:hypothetical protein KR032_003573 [Drosophila birchii]
MGDSSFSDLLPAINMPDLPSYSRNWSTSFDPFYVPLIPSLFPSLHPESMLSTSQSSSQVLDSSPSNPHRAPISDDQKIELMRLQERVGEDELPVDWERGFEEISNESPRDISNDSDQNSNRYGRSVYFS